MYKINRLPETIDIGYTGEHQFREIQIDMTPWMELMPAGVPSIVHIRPGETKDDAYKAETTFENNILTWKISMSDLGSEDGRGLAQVWLEDITDETLELNHRGKSVNFMTVVHGSVGTIDSGIPGDIINWKRQLDTKVDKTDVINDLDVVTEGKVLDARQGKVLDNKKINRTSIVNNLSATEEGYVLDARQGKALDDKKIDKNNIINDLTATEAGGVLDARQGKALDDKKVDIQTAQGEGKFLQTDSEGKAIWGNAASPTDIANAVTTWLENNIPTGTTVAIDRSLTTEGAAADANITGRSVKSIKNSSESAIDKILNTRPLVFVPGYYRVYRTSDDTTVDITAPEISNTTSKTMVTAITPCSPGDVFTVRAYGGASAAAAYGFLDANCKGKGRQGASALVEDTFTIPDGVAYLIVNNNLTNNPTNYYAFKGKLEYPFALKGSLTEENDLDDLCNTSDRGWYYWNSTHSPSEHAPGNGAYKLLVFSNSSTSVTQIALPLSTTAHVRYRTKTTSGWSDWLSLAYLPELESAISGVDSIITGIKNDIYYPITDFQQGNINASGKNSSNQHPIRTGYIPIEDFVSVEVLGKSANDNEYRYQLFAYDASYTYLGFGNNSHRSVSTRADVLTAYPATKYVRIKVTGGDDGTNLAPSILDEYEYTGLTRDSMEAINNNSMYNDITDIQSALEAKQDEDGTYTESFEVVVDLAADPKILSIVAQYTGDMPTIKINSYNPSSNVVNLASPYYELGGTREPTRKSWRIPAAHSAVKKAKIIFTIPSGTVVTIREASIHNDQRNRYADAGIIFHGHIGSIAPGNSVEAFQYGAELGYNSMITIPKFTADGTAICFHDDTSISGDLCWVDGTPITGTDDKAISEYTYAEITENFRLKSVLWGTLHVPTLDEYFRVCSLTGMSPILSIHSSPSGMFTGTTGTSHFNTIKALAKKWNVLHKLGIKSGSDSIMSCARNVFGTVARYIWISGQTHAPYNIFNLSKNAGFVDSSATDLTGCQYDLCSEYFYKQTTESGTYYSDTVASMTDMLSKGFKLSVADSDPYMTGPEMKRLISSGVTEFTVDKHISMGLDW